MNNLIYDINDSPKELKEYLLYGAQQMISVLAATLLICKLKDFKNLGKFLSFLNS